MILVDLHYLILVWNYILTGFDPVTLPFLQTINEIVIVSYQKIYIYIHFKKEKKECTTINKWDHNIFYTSMTQQKVLKPF